MNRSAMARALAKGIRVFVIVALLAGFAVALQPTTLTVRAGPAYQPPTNNVYVIHAGAYVGINTPIGTADDVNSGAANCTLRDALGIVNAGTISGTVNGCTITQVGAPAASIYRINLPTGDYTYTLDPANGELLTSANTLYIVGDTAVNTIIQANAAPNTATYRVLQNNGAIVELGNVTIRHGRCAGACAANGRDGGGIYNQAGTVTVNGSIVSANQADNWGGGIFSWATLNVQNGSIIGGAGAANQARYGGGIFNLAGTTTVNASTVSANQASGFGGGIFNNATLNVQNGSTIGGAGAANMAKNGGGVYNWAGIMTVDASTVNANMAAWFGGGICNQDTLNIQSSTVSANTASADGGGIYNGPGTTTVNASTVSANTAAGDGGGIHNWVGSTTVTNSRILYNTATANGGGVYSDVDAAGATSVTGGCIVGNRASSFFNSQAAQQTATGNWWGAATGPNTPGADTTSGNVDTSGFETVPILGCPANYPDLQVNKVNDTGGNGTVGMAFNWTLTVANADIADAIFNAGQRILEDDLPTGPTYGAPAPGNFANITNTVNISCAIAANTLTCGAAGADVTIGAATGCFDVVVPVTPNAAGLLSNPAGNCRVDPNNDVTESDEGNNDCLANNVNVAPPAPSPSPGDDDDDDEPPPAPTATPTPKAREFNCWPWLVIVPPGAAPNAVPGEWCQASLGKPLLGTSNFRYLGHSTEVSIKDAAGVAITSFAQPIKVCFRYTQPELDAVGGDLADFLIQVFRNGTWEALDTKADSSLRYPGVCAPVSHLTLFALFARDGAAPDASAAPASDSTLLFPTHLPGTGERPLGSGRWGLLVAGVAILAMGVSAWLLRRR